MNKRWLWEWRRCKTVCLYCLWRGLGWACPPGGHIFGCTAHGGGKHTWKQKVLCLQLYPGHMGGRSVYFVKVVPMACWWFSEVVRPAFLEVVRRLMRSLAVGGRVCSKRGTSVGQGAGLMQR